MKRTKMTKNEIFRKYLCDLTIEETAKLCFTSVMQVKLWDEGEEIPQICRRLMKVSKGRESIHPNEQWEGFKMNKLRMETPTGQLVTPQEILAGLALLEIQSPEELQTTSKLVKHARAIANIKMIQLTK